jgi:hypothetical protein
MSLLRKRHIINGRDLNFYLRGAKVRGSPENVDVLSKCLVQKLEELRIYNIELVKLNPT